jgi:hypothetical protein
MPVADRWRRQETLGGGGRAILCFGSGRPVLGLPSASASACPTRIGAIDAGEHDARLPQRNSLPVAVLHPVHELEHLAGRLAGEAMVDPLAEVHRAAGLLVGMKGAQDLHLLAFPDRLEAVVGEDGAEVRATSKIIEVNTSVVGHNATATVS